MTFRSWKHSFVQNLAWTTKNSSKHQPKTHDYTRQQSGRDYILESSPDGQYYITAWGKKVKPGDRVKLTQDNELATYRVCELDRYSDPPDMWTASMELIATEPFA
jgi:MioC protein